MAVYTDVSFEELEVFLASYDLGHAHVFKGIAEGVVELELLSADLDAARTS